MVSANGRCEEFEIIMTEGHDQDPIATTTCGRIRGYRVSDRVIRFTHIPYARAPPGEFRFLAPVPASEWEGIRDCREHGPSIIQAPDEVEANSLPPQSEDCLWLSTGPRDSNERRAHGRNNAR